MIAATAGTGIMRPFRSLAHERGFTLVELMVGIALGLIVLAALIVVFVSASSNRRDMERTGRQIENGRYAMQLLDDDLVNAGYFGELDPNIVGAPGAKPDPCSTDAAALKTAVMMHIQGYDAAAVKPACIAADVRANTAVVVIRRASTCIAGVANCDPLTAGGIYVQASLCNTELADPLVSARYAVAVSPAGPFSLKKRDCAAPAVLRGYVVHIYFIANNNNPGDGIPTLKRAELSGDGVGPAFDVVPLVEGIENLQVEYGVDTDGDGKSNVITADPGTRAGCAADPCYIDNWINTMTAKLYVLARTTETTPGHKDTKEYAMGLAGLVGPFNDGFKRHAYSQMIRLTNPAGRRE